MTTHITGASPMAATPPPSKSGDALGELDGHAFLKLLVAQLRYQNPMEPSDPAALLQQTSQLRQVEALQGLTDAQAKFSRMNEASMAAGLVGKQVDAVDADGGAVQGVVDGVRFTEEGPVLLVGDRQVPFASILGISAPPE